MNNREGADGRPTMSRRACLQAVSAAAVPVSLSLAGRECAGEYEQTSPAAQRGDVGPTGTVIRPGGASHRVPAINLGFADDVGMAEWWLPELVLPGHTDRGMVAEGTVVWRTGSSAGSHRYEHVNPSGRLALTAELWRVELGWAASLTIANRSSDVWPDVVATICLLLHPSHVFVDPEWKRTYYRSGGRYLTYFGRERDGGEPVYQMSLVRGRRQIERSQRHINKWGFTREPSDDGIIAVVGKECATTLVTTWDPTHHLQANRKGTFHCIHANALVGTLKAGESRSVRGCVLLVSGDLDEVWKQANAAVGRS